jgi:hypothetical protein
MQAIDKQVVKLAESTTMALKSSNYNNMKNPAAAKQIASHIALPADSSTDGFLK